MKLTNVVFICALSAGLFLAKEPLLAQAPPPGLPGAAVNLQSAAVVPPKKIASLKIKKGGLMGGAVAELLETMKAAQLPEINVLYGPGAEQVPVPELNLRNVTGPDALRLMAVSADCEAEPILGDRSDVIIGGGMVRKLLTAVFPHSMKLRESLRPWCCGGRQWNTLAAKARFACFDPMAARLSG